MSLRKEISQNCSGRLYNIGKISTLKEENYYVVNIGLDGDAPKQFIKAYFHEHESGVRKRNRKSWIPFIAKSAEKWYPHESVIEFMINRIGIELGLRMNEVKLVIANGQIRFLSRYFRKDAEVLVHGAEICGEYIDDLDMAEEIANNKKTSRQLFTFEFISKAIKHVFPNCCDDLLFDLVKMITFDAIVGNNDRHFYNWGILKPVKKTGKMPIFAPIYDSARGLLWNESEDNIVKHHRHNWQGGKKLVNYIDDAKPRISIENNANINHFGLITFVKGLDTKYQDIVNNLISREKEQQVLQMLGSEIFHHFSKERCELMVQILKSRFEKLRSS